jgi:molybdopterin synthase catalytic subunit/molybdopterin converting factor small subunit
MQVKIRLFGQLSQLAGSSEIALTLPDGATAQDALTALGDVGSGLPLIMAVNREYVTPSHRLAPGDELAAIPPLSGGSVTIHASVRAERLCLDAVTARVSDPRAGAVVVFCGVTRDVASLEYDAYAEMAEREIARIAERAIQEHDLCAAAVEHRVGTVPLSEPAVIAAVSAPHRDAAFRGARQIIDQIKTEAPLWKREQDQWKHEAIPVPRDPN